MATLLALIVPALGTLLIIAVVWIGYGRRDARLADAAEAARRLAEDWAGFRAAEVLVDRDGRTALAVESPGESGARRVGIVYAFGDRLPTRLVQPAEIRAVRIEAPGRLVLETDDFGHPDFVVTAADPAEAERWRARLAALGGPSARAGAA